jgi:hypothetical protein
MNAPRALLQRNCPPTPGRSLRREAESGAAASGMRPKEGYRDEKIWKQLFWVCDPYNPLKFPKTAKAFFGNPCTKLAEIWRSLEKRLGARLYSAISAPPRRRVSDIGQRVTRRRRSSAQSWLRKLQKKAPEALKSLNAKLKSAPGTGRPPPAFGERASVDAVTPTAWVQLGRHSEGEALYDRRAQRARLHFRARPDAVGERIQGIADARRSVPVRSRSKAMGGGARAFANARSDVRGREREKDRSRGRRGLPRRRRFPRA